MSLMKPGAGGQLFQIPPSYSKSLLVNTTARADNETDPCDDVSKAAAFPQAVYV